MSAVETSASKRVAIVSHQPLCRDALTALAAQELRPERTIAVAALEALRDVGGRADLLIADLPASADARAWLAAAREALDCPARVLLTEPSLPLARLARASGFRALLPKTAEPPLMAAVFRLALAGGEYFPCFDALADAPAPGDDGLLERLSKRQRQVLDELRLGRTNKEIAKSLGISLATVKLHVQAILAVAGARNRTEAVSRLVRDLA